MQIKEAIVSNGYGALYPSYFVVHETANPGATAKNHVDYWRRDPTYAVHYVLDWNECFHCIPNNRLAYHVGGGNAQTYGVELCHATTKANFQKVWDAAVELCADQLRAKNWGVDRLLSHYDCTMRWGGSDHTDPIGYFQKYGKTWEQFKEDVRKRLIKKEVDMTTKEMTELVEKFKYAVWGFKNPGLEKVDTYQILRDIRDGVNKANEKLDSIVKKL